MRLNIEDRFFSETRFWRLSHMLGGDHIAVGYCALLWHGSQGEEALVGSWDELRIWLRIVDRDVAASVISALCTCNFVVKKELKFFIAGNEQQINSARKNMLRYNNLHKSASLSNKRKRKAKTSDVDNQPNLKDYSGACTEQKSECVQAPCTEQKSECVQAPAMQGNARQINARQCKADQGSTDKELGSINPKPVKQRKTGVEPTDFHKSLAARWADYATSAWPNLNPKVSDWEKSLAQISQEVGLNDQQMGALFEFIRKDDFWKDNCQSPIGLLRKSRNGVRKVDNILAKIKREHYSHADVFQRLKESQARDDADRAAGRPVKNVFERAMAGEYDDQL